ncbi:hypothetical protein F4604DRAFT_1686689 [Suillus subluteus]|nr:hypothetical protein F4604DRAFT_1686689 [Suillus subluteus]
MYDGPIVVLYTKPSLNRDAYYTCKSNYGLNLQGNEFAWVNSAYPVSKHTIPVHKQPASLLPENAHFDSAVAHLWVHSGHYVEGTVQGEYFAANHTPIQEQEDQGPHDFPLGQDNVRNEGQAKQHMLVEELLAFWQM